MSARRETWMFGGLVVVIGSVVLFSGVSGQRDATNHMALTGASLAAPTATPIGGLIARRAMSGREATTAGVTLASPRDNAKVTKFDGATDFYWNYGAGYEGDTMSFRQGNTVAASLNVSGSYGATINNAYFRAGTYSWCVSIRDSNYNPAGEACRTVVRRPAHASVLTSASWYGVKGNFSGEVASASPTVRVKVVLKQRNAVVSTSKWITVRTKEHGRAKTFSYSAKIKRDTDASRLTAFITVSGGGVTQKFRNALT